jgi:hypothetical protein
VNRTQPTVRRECIRADLAGVVLPTPIEIRYGSGGISYPHDVRQRFSDDRVEVLERAGDRFHLISQFSGRGHFNIEHQCETARHAAADIVNWGRDDARMNQITVPAFDGNVNRTDRAILQDGAL